MKTVKIITVVALAATVLSSCCSGSTKIAKEDAKYVSDSLKATLPTSGQIDTMSYLMGVNFGLTLKFNNMAADKSELNSCQMKKGMEDAFKAEGEFGTPEFAEQFEISPELMDSFLNGFVQQKAAFKCALNKAKGAGFLAAKAAEEGVAKSESGLCYKIIEKGDDVVAADGDTVWCKYTGTTIEGKEFDSTAKHGGDSIKFVIDSKPYGGAIAGFKEGLKLVGQGGKATLYIPENLAYGERQVNALIGAGSTLVFDIEVCRVGKKAEEAEVK